MAGCATRRTNESTSSVSNASESWDKGCASVTPKTAGDSVVVVPTRRSSVERQDRVAREIGGNGLCRCRMNLHHFIEIIKNRLKDSISETLRQIRARDREVIDSKSLII